MTKLVILNQKNRMPQNIHCWAALRSIPCDELTELVVLTGVLFRKSCTLTKSPLPAANAKVSSACEHTSQSSITFRCKQYQLMTVMSIDNEQRNYELICQLEEITMSGNTVLFPITLLASVMRLSCGLLLYSHHDTVAAIT